MPAPASPAAKQVNRAEIIDRNFTRFVQEYQGEPVPCRDTLPNSGLGVAEFIGLFESQIMSRHLDLMARVLRLENKVFYRMYRGVDVRDVVSAHVRALETSLDNFEIFNISAQPLFTEDDLGDLRKDVMKVLEKKAPRLISFYQERGWEIPSFIDRVYVIGKAKYFLDYKPRHNLEEMLTELSAS